MPSRHILNNVICVASAAALMLAVIFSPIRPSSLSGVSARHDYLRQSVAVPPIHKARMALHSTGTPTSRVKALTSEGEEEDGTKSESAFHGSANPRPSRPVAAQKSISHLRTQAARPLRC